MTLTQTERILLISSLQTLKAQLLGLKAQGPLPDDGPTIEGCDFAIEALEMGFTIYYPVVADAVGAPSLGDEIPHKECAFTLDVLEMFRQILDYRKKNPEDKAAKDSSLDFGGFDGNYEGRYASLAEFVVKRVGYCPELKRKKFRGGLSPMVDQYRCMVERWRKSPNRARLTREDVADILKAAEGVKAPEVSHAA